MITGIRLRVSFDPVTASIDEALSPGELPPAPDVVRGVFGVYERNQLEVCSIRKWYEGVTAKPSLL